MDSSMEDFLKDYFGNGTPSYEDSQQQSPPIPPTRVNNIANFSIGADELLMDSYFRSTAGTQESTSPSQANSFKVITGHASRRYMSYDIIFNKAKGVVIHSNNKVASPLRIQTKQRTSISRIPEKSFNPRASTSTEIDKLKSRLLIAEEDLARYRTRNVELEVEVGTLRDKLENAQETISLLEVEVANLYFQ